MSRIRKIVVAGALAVASVVPLTVAEAMPVTNAPAKAEKSSDVQQARWCGRWRCGYRRAWRPRARIWVRPRGGEWVEEFTTEDFALIAGGSAADAYALDTEWLSGYPTSLYDVQIDLYDSASDLLVASAGSDWDALSQIPLEDQSRDRRASSPTPPSGGDSSSREGGGGSWSVLGLLGLALALLTRTVVQRKRALIVTRSVR